MMVIYPISQNCNDHGKLLTSMSTDAKITYEILTDEFGTHTYLCVSVCVYSHLSFNCQLDAPWLSKESQLGYYLDQISLWACLGGIFLDC